MFDIPAILNLHDLKGFPTSVNGCQAVNVAEDRSLHAVTHLALSRRQNTGNGILGIYKR